MTQATGAGWFPNPDNDAELRYWDGLSWTDHISERQLVTSPVEIREKKPGPKRRVRVWVPVVTGVLGLFIGGAVGAADGSAAKEISSLEQQLEVVETDKIEVKEELQAVTEDFEEQQEGLALEAQEAAQLAEEATERAVLAEEKLLVAESAQAEAELAAADALAQVSQAPVPFAGDPAPAPAPEVSAYYQNCSAVRAAGAAPIYSGQAGYGSHLDRDGDGVGCE